MDTTIRRTIGIFLLIVGSAATHNRLAARLDAQTAAYSIADLGTLGGDSSEAFGLNNLGDVVGAGTTAAGATHAFLYRNGDTFDLGTLPGGSSSYATAINDRGDIVGYGGINSFGPPFREFTQGFVFQNGAMRAIGALYCPCTFNVRYGTSMAFAVSNAGLVFGDSQTNRQTYRGAFVWQDATMRELDFDGALLDDAHAYGVNDIHEVVGDDGTHAFLMHEGASRDLGVLPGHATSSARAVNNKGQVVGRSSDASGTPRGFLWDLGRMRDLGTLAGDAASEALDVNDASDVVGRSGSADWTTTRAVLWRGGVAIDLTALAGAADWILTNATAINDLGQIAGVGMHNGRPRAFLLTAR
jgi:probable HAF family extracellular repeat protein